MFILCSEFLTRMLGVQEELGTLHGIKISWSGSAVSHLLYANDLLIMCRAIRQKAHTVKKCFELYCDLSGQEANAEKSSIFFSKGTAAMERVETKNILDFKKMSKNSIYLGNSLLVSRYK